MRRSIILIIAAFLLMACVASPPPLTTSKTASYPMKPYDPIASFAKDVESYWTELNTGSSLRLVFSEFDTNTDSNFALSAKREIERSFIKLSGITIIERTDIAKILDEQAFQASNFFSMNDMKPLKLEIADAVVYGLLEDNGNGKIQLTLSCLEYETARVIARQSIILTSDFSGYSEYTKRLSAPLPPPRNLRAEEAVSTVKLEWDTVHAYDAVYEVLRSDSYDVDLLYTVIGKVSVDPKAQPSIKSIQFIDKNVIADKKYFYKIRYISRGKESDLSSVVFASPYSLPPTILRLSGIWNYDMQAAIVTWTISSEGTSGYEYEAIAGTKRFSGTVEVPVLTLREYEADVPLSVRIRAISIRGIKGEFSSWIIIPIPPVAVSDLEAVQEKTTVGIRWKYPNTGEVHSFAIYVSKDDGPFMPIGNTIKNEFSYSDFNTGSKLRFQIKTINNAGLEGPYSNSVTLITHTDPPAPIIRSAKAVSRFILIEWQGKYYLDIQGYRLSVREPDGHLSVIYNGLDTSYTYSAMKPGVYLFSLFSLNTIGQISDATNVEIEMPISAF